MGSHVSCVVLYFSLPLQLSIIIFPGFISFATFNRASIFTFIRTIAPRHQKEPDEVARVTGYNAAWMPPCKGVPGTYRGGDVLGRPRSHGETPKWPGNTWEPRGLAVRNGWGEGRLGIPAIVAVFSTLSLRSAREWIDVFFVLFYFSNSANLFCLSRSVFKCTTLTLGPQTPHLDVLTSLPIGRRPIRSAPPMPCCDRCGNRLWPKFTRQSGSKTLLRAQFDKDHGGVMDLNFYSHLTGGSGQHDGDPGFLDPQSFNGFDSDNKYPGGSDNYLAISGSGHPFLAPSETFHTPSLGDEEFEIPPISLDPDSSLTVSDVVSHFGELSDASPSNSVVVPGNAVVEGDDPSFASTFVHPPSQGLEHLSLGVINQSGGALLGSSLGMDLGHPIGSQFSSSSPVTIDVPLGDMSQGLLGSNQLTTIDQSELSAQLGLGLGAGNILQRPQSPERPLSATASPTSSLQDDDMDDFRRSILVESPISQNFCPGVISLDPAVAEAPTSGLASGALPLSSRKGGSGRGGKTGKKKEDPNEPPKPVPAYALFFRDTQAAIKGQNPKATIGEVSKIVASMWDSLGKEQKQVYKRKNELAKKDYLRALAEYRANLNCQVPIEVLDSAPSPPPAPASSRPSRAQQYNPEENTITNICTSNIILDLPQVTTRSRTGAIRPQPPTESNPPTVAKIIIKQTQLPSGGVSVTAMSASSPRQPPPLQQMQSTPPPPRLQQMVHAQAPPPLQAKPRGGGAVASAAPPPLQIKVVPSVRQVDPGAQLIVASSCETSNSAKAAGQSAAAAAAVTRGEEVMEAEEGMEVEVKVAPGPGITPTGSPNICVRTGCTNPAVDSKDWDKEYCSNECVATHCRDVFTAWCAIRGQNSTTVT
ncbi:TOX high mobility group box family member 4b isoform X2 [Syngnathus typhle]|uniref:TOX high mobility group box family member 4b isoform X2 n=1 Tax=Syngnathus typhle TaxID=161592 RepID=UPI002A6A68BA|nr:TOX high mobility group box family member 4b isoform X2 [Syngnathus typhle]